MEPKADKEQQSGMPKWMLDQLPPSILLSHGAKIIAEHEAKKANRITYQDIFSMENGNAQLTWCMPKDPAEYKLFCEWLDSVKKRTGRFGGMSGISVEEASNGTEA